MTLSISPRKQDDGLARSLEASSSTSMSPPGLGSNVMAMLGQFQKERQKQEAKFAKLHAKSRAQERARLAAQRKQDKQDADDAEAEAKVLAKARAEAEEQEHEEEESMAEAEAWADIERLARIDAGIEDPFIETMSLSSSGTGESTEGEEDEEDDVIDVDEWRQLVQEDFGQSQFWYSSAFAYKLARHIHSHLRTLDVDHTPRIAFLCSPTAFVAFQYLYGGNKPGRDFKAGENTWMMEIDERFKVVAGDGFARYDYNFPTKGLADLQGKIDMVVIDPPYLNRPTTDCIAKTVAHLLSPPSERLPRGGSILLITGETIGAYASQNYPLQGQPDLRKTMLEVEHQGGRLSNEFAAWASWEGAEKFGAGDGEGEEIGRYE